MATSLRILLFGTLRRRLIFAVAAVHAVMMSLFILDLSHRHKALLLERQSDQVAASVNALAAASSSWMAAKDLSGLQELVDAQRQYPGLRYAMILDDSGRILAHSEPAYVGQYLRDLPARRGGVAILQKGTIIEGHSPVSTSNHFLGWAMVGIDQAGIQGRLAAVTRDGLIYTLGAIFVGSFLAWVVGIRFTRRLSKLQAVMEEVREGNSHVRSNVPGSDEAADLAIGFNDMLDQLEQRSSELLRANQALSESGAENQALLSAIPDLIFTNHRDGKYLGVHISDPALLLVKPEDFLQRNIIEVLPQPLAERFLKAFADALDLDEVQEINYTLSLAGAEKSFEARVASCGEDMVITIVRDVTTHKIAEEALKASEERFNTAFQFTPVALGVTTLGEGRFLTVNRAFEDIYGYSAAELEGREVLEVGIWADAETRSGVLARLLSGQVIRGQEVQIRRKDGTFRWVSYSAQQVTMRGIPCLLSGAVDITDRKEAEAKLRESESHLRTIIDNEPECIKIVDEAGRLIHMNAAGLAMIEADSLEQVAGAPVVNVIAPEYREAYLQMHRRVIAGEPAKLAYEVLGLKGGRRWLETHAVPMLEQGKVVHLAVTRDITEHRRAAEENAKLEAQLHQAQKMESLGNLAGGIAHDMNNVLGAILGLASASIEAQPPESPTRQVLATIIKAAERGGTTVKGLLNLARQRPAEESDLDLNAILREEVRLLERTTLSKVRLNLELAEDLRPIRGDAGALSHAFMNLCVNAVDAMTENGTLTLRTRNLDQDLVEVQVEDTGCGMPKEIQEKALDPFFTTKGVGKGTGLGLSIVYSTVKVHHGQFEIQSEPGRGTCVIMRFPACATSTKPLDVETGSRAEKPRTSLRVLLVDDDELIQSSTQMILEALGHRATISSCGENALEKISQGLQPDVVILDMNMPGLGGAGTLPRLRTLLPEVPILLATGRADQLAQRLVENHPQVTLLMKPFSMGELETNLEELVRVRSST
ncbi:MAG TPA: PAS domain S-box protein [Geothrix sp.]|nr:PAS domain S-box protein [Geothrix sp.]